MPFNLGSRSIVVLMGSFVTDTVVSCYLEYARKTKLVRDYGSLRIICK